MLDRSLIASSVLALLGTATLVTAQPLTTIAAGSATLTVTMQGSNRHNLACDSDGVLWALVRDVDAAGVSRLYLSRSLDSGRTWIGRYDTSTVVDSAGAICAGRGCGELHVTWSAHNGSGLYDVYYQAFDARARVWIGTPTLLTNATNANDQYYAQDIAETESGHLVVAITTHRAPPAPWTSGWSAGLFVRPRGATAFNPVRQVNTDAYGQFVDVQAIGDVIHCAFRTNTGLYGTRYRGFDTTTLTFTTPGDVQVDPGTSNVSNIAADAIGYLYVIYAKGGSTAGTGEIWVATAAPGNYTTWTPHLVAADATLVRGNVSDQNYSLASDGLGQVFVFYSKAAEQYRSLYVRLMQNGALVTPEAPIAITADADRFIVVSGVRNSNNVLPPAAVIESRAAIHPGWRVEYLSLGSSGRGTRYGVGCKGSAAAAPTVRAISSPVLGGNLDFALTGPSPNLPGLLQIGLDCLPQPFDLGVIGMNGCFIMVAAFAEVGVPLGPGGVGVASFQIPANATFVDLPFHFQGAVLAPGANPVGALLSNTQMVLIR